MMDERQQAVQERAGTRPPPAPINTNPFLRPGMPITTQFPVNPYNAGFAMTPTSNQTYNQATNFGTHPANTPTMEYGSPWATNPFVSGQGVMDLQRVLSDPFSQYDARNYYGANFGHDALNAAGNPAGPNPRVEEPQPPPNPLPIGGGYNYAPYQYPAYPAYGGGGGSGNQAYAWMSKLLNWNVNK